MEFTIKNKMTDGWDSFQESQSQTERSVHVNKHLEGRNILEEQYSLEPDMLQGWMPKLPSCPIPLTYQNKYTENVLEKIASQDKYDLVYKAKRLINSVQVHKSYDYRWKYRERYEIKVNLVAEAIENVGIAQQKEKKTQKIINERIKPCPIAFDSNFQSGNLDFATRIKQNQYDCFMRSDTNTRGHTNWYYFKVNNMESLGIVKFNICNIVKTKNLYGKGMTPYTMVRQKYNEKNVEWHQNKCRSVQFNERLCKYGTETIYNQLQFTFNFTTENMEVYFAYSIPYTFSDLQKYISQIRNNPLVKIQNLCESFSGLEIPLIVISNNDKRKKCNALITARIHPGQTNSSHMLQGFINEILKEKASCSILNYCNFYIVPMMNPDGVVGGNYRTSFSGRDLNRKFNQPQSFLYPEINGLTHLIKKLKKKRQNIEFFFDFHSHSAKKDLFCYGPEHPKGHYNYLRARLLVKMLQKQGPMFNGSKCIYSISQYKKTTCRSYMINKEHIPMTFTFEVSNGLYALAKDYDTTYDLESLHKAGSIIEKALLEYLTFQSYDRFSKFKEKRVRYPRNSENLSKYSNTFKTQNAKRLQTKGSTLGTSLSMSSTFQYKELLNQIISLKDLPEKVQQTQSDNESSEEDIKDAELKYIFNIREKYNNSFSQFKITPQQKNNSTNSKKASLRNILNETITKKSSVQVNLKSSKVYVTTNSLPTQAKITNKYKRNRIFYEQTHPPAPKKIYQNTFLTKKVIKQKRFPIIF